MKRSQGFSLIELMVVITVIAILALIALPSYLDKIVRDQITEALPLADIATRPIAQVWALTQKFPADNAEIGLPEPGKIVSNWITAVTVQDGAVHLSFGNRANGSLKGKTLSLRPAVVEDAPVVPVTWVCGHASVPEKMKATGGNKTDIPKAYLPLRCR